MNLEHFVNDALRCAYSTQQALACYTTITSQPWFPHAIVGLLALAILLLFFRNSLISQFKFTRHVWASYWGRRRMRAMREKQLKMFVTDIVTDAVEDAVFRKQEKQQGFWMDRDEANWIFKQLGNRFDRDFLKWQESTPKEEIAARLGIAPGEAIPKDKNGKLVMRKVKPIPFPKEGTNELEDVMSAIQAKA